MDNPQSARGYGEKDAEQGEYLQLSCGNLGHEQHKMVESVDADKRAIEVDDNGRSYIFASIAHGKRIRVRLRKSA